MVGDLRDGELIGPHVFGELGLAQALQTEIELGHGEAFHAQGRVSSGDQTSEAVDPLDFVRA